MALAAVGSAAALALSPVEGQQPPAQPPATVQPPAGAPAQPPTAAAPGTPPPPAVPASRKFTADAGMIFSVVKPDKTTDFEAVMARVKEGLAKSQDPKRKQQAQACPKVHGTRKREDAGWFPQWNVGTGAVGSRARLGIGLPRSPTCN